MIGQKFCTLSLFFINRNRPRTLCLKGRIYSNGSIFSVLNIDFPHSFSFLFIIFLIQEVHLFCPSAVIWCFSTWNLYNTALVLFTENNKKKKFFCKKRKILMTKHDFILFFFINRPIALSNVVAFLKGFLLLFLRLGKSCCHPHSQFMGCSLNRCTRRITQTLHSTEVCILKILNVM